MEPHAHPDSLIPLLNAVRIYDAATFGLRDEAPIPVASVPLHPSATQVPQADPVTGPLVLALQATLYERAYTTPFGRPGSTPPAPPPPGDTSFIEALAAANTSRDGWDPGWSVYQLGTDGQVFVQKGDRHRSPRPGEFIRNGDMNTPLAPGAAVTLRVPRESREMQPGFYFAFGETLSDVFDDFGMMRLYFHTPSLAATPLLGALTVTLNRYGIPFRLKTLTQPQFFVRTDAFVLYTARRHTPLVLALVQALPDSVLGLLRESVPLFTKQLHPGIGVAEDPGTNESFGMHRCRLVAEGIVDAWKAGQTDARPRIDAIRARFAALGLSLDAPFLNADSTDCYAWPTPLSLTL